ncbi:MAG: cytochrome c, partial [Planctomycetaceae bacterium]|nr:cytochrome c [Planctomycetaceae bacterium]
PNTLYDLQTLTEDVRLTKLRLGKPLAHMDKGSFLYPLSRSIGTTNAVMFGTILLTYRDPDLTFQRDRELPALVHHDHDAPAWWHYHRKTRLYSDGFAPKSHRALLQFLLIPKNGPDKFREWEDDYRAVSAWIESLTPPKYPGQIDAPLANRGRFVFNEHCAKCHGTYGAQPTWPEKIVSIDDVGTDRARLDSLAGDGRKRWGASWFAYFGKRPTIDEPGGYVAPPLDGIWASAPYLHNGAVPTLWHLLHPDERPVVWQRSEDGYDHERIGLEVTTYDTMPAEIVDPRQQRRYFNTRLFGKSATGHDYPAALAEPDRRAVLEYLKTL